MFTDFFIRRPVFASVCSLLIILLGLVGYPRLAVQEFPSIDPPVVSVTTTYPGANPQVVETEITEILEEEINGVEGIKTLSSESRESVSVITVQFELERDLELAAQDVRDRVSRVTGELPDDADTPIVSKESGDASPILFFALYSDRLSTLEITDYAENFIINDLETVQGVSSIFIGGERRYAMRLWLDPQQLAGRGLTVLDVEQALRQGNVEVPGGIIEGQESEYSVRTLGRLQTPAEYEDLILRRDADGSQVTLKDVGRAEVGAEDERTFARFKGQPAIALGVIKLSDANTLAVAEGARQAMSRLAKGFPEGLEYAIAFDTSEFVAIAIDEVRDSLLLAIVLVVLVIFLFLRDWRATLIPTVTIAVSLIGAFAIMFFLDFSINTLTLFALTLSTGLVVDDTIVVLENIVRYMEEKRVAPFPATFAATAEVVFAVIATTLVLVAVFVPVAFSSGTTGRIFNEFALTIAGAVVISSFVSLTLTPAMCARLLRQEGSGNNWFFDFFEALVSRSRDIYGSSLSWLMRARILVVLFFVVSMGVTGFIFTQLPREFLPEEDRGVVLTIVQAPQGVTLNYTDRVIQQVEQVFSQIPEVESYFTIGAFGGGSGPGQVNEGIAFAKLKPWSERRAREQSQGAIIGQLFGQFAQVTDAFVLPIPIPALPGAGFGQSVEFVLQGNNLESLAKVADDLANQSRLKLANQLVNVDTNLKLNKPELILEVDRRRAAELGVSVQDISRSLQILLGGQDITSFNRENRRYEVVVQADRQYRTNPDNIRSLYVRTESGGVVPLSNVVNITAATTPPRINHFNRARSATITGSPAPGVTLGTALDALQNLAQQIVPAEVRTALAGQSLEFVEAGQATIFIFGLAVVFIFLALAAQFESYIDPLIIMLAVPLSLLGAFSLLWFTAQTLNVYSQIGLIILVGLVTKNSILIIEFAKQLREQGRSVVEAAIEAGRVRYRPILMTAFSTILGTVPLALASGAGAASRVPLGMAVVGGMLVSTFLSLYVVPVFYVMAETAIARLEKRRHARQFREPEPVTTMNDKL